MTQQWTRLNREQAGAVLEQLSTRKDAVVFSKDYTEVSWRELSFYKRYRLCRLVNYATMPTFSMTYLSNDEEFISLDGTANPIYTANEQDPIRLSATNIISYLEFFFSNVQGSEGDVFLIRDPRKMPMMNTLNPAQQESIISSFKPLSVTTDNSGNFKVSGTLYYGGGLTATTVAVAPDGKISFQEQSLLLSGIYFPDSLYSPAWVEG